MKRLHFNLHISLDGMLSEYGNRMFSEYHHPGAPHHLGALTADKSPIGHKSQQEEAKKKLGTPIEYQDLGSGIPCFSPATEPLINSELDDTLWIRSG